MKSAEEWADIIAVEFSGDRANQQMIERIQQVRREQHEATIRALQQEYLKTGLYRASFESTQEEG